MIWSQNRNDGAEEEGNGKTTVFCLRDCTYSISPSDRGRYSSPGSSEAISNSGSQCLVGSKILAHMGHRIGNTATYSLYCRKRKPQLFLYIHSYVLISSHLYEKWVPCSAAEQTPLPPCCVTRSAQPHSAAGRRRDVGAVVQGDNCGVAKRIVSSSLYISTKIHYTWFAELQTL